MYKVPSLSTKPLNSFVLFGSDNVVSGYDGINDVLITRDIALVLKDAIHTLKRYRNAPFNEIAYAVNKCEVDYEVYTEGYSGYYVPEQNKMVLTEIYPLTFIHELCHSLQSKVLDFDRMDFFNVILAEQQCETMAYYLYNSVYPYMDNSEFSGYFDFDDIEFVSRQFCGA